MSHSSPFVAGKRVRALIAAAFMLSLLAGASTPTQAQRFQPQLLDDPTQDSGVVAVSNTGDRRVLPNARKNAATIVDEHGRQIWIAPGRAARASQIRPGEEGTTRPERDVALENPHDDEAGITRVIGTDDRQRISPTTHYPTSAVVELRYAQSGRGGVCTGWLYDDNYIATAAHCLYGDLDRNGSRDWSYNVQVYPGRDGTVFPYQSCTAVRLTISQAWLDFGRAQDDYAVAQLNCTVGNVTGWFGFRYAPSSWAGQGTWLSGYHGDKDSHTTQWRTYATITSDDGARLYYAHDMTPGSSGAPVYSVLYGCDYGCAIGINAYEGTYNSATRITQAVYDFLQAHR